MNERQTISMLANQIRMMTSRATIREFDDGHLMQQVKHADVYHSETPSDFERWQMAGISSHPLKQDKDDKQQKSKQGSGGASGTANQGDWNHDQPKGKAAEAIMLYPGGNRSHPIAIVDDRRVRPYNMPEGASSFYDVSGTGQMLYFNDSGAHLVSVDNPRYGKGSDGKDNEEKERYASLRHVKKKPQEREVKEGQQQEEYKHEGEEVLTEIRATAKLIEIRDGETVIAQYKKEDKSWTFSNFKTLTFEVEEELNLRAPEINLEGEDITVTASGTLDLNGKPINFNGGGPSVPPFTVPG